MTEFIQINILITIFYAIYMWVLKNKQGAIHNRIFLLVALGVSTLVPWINMSFSAGPTESVTMAQVLPTLVVSSTKAISSDWLNYVTWLYLAVSLILATALVAAFIKIKRLVKKPLGSYAGYHLFLIKPNCGTFSFYNSIYIDSDEKNPLILEHEVRHLNQHHYIDNLVVELLAVVFWINPIVWLLKNEVKENLEYAADRSVIEDQKESIEEYVELLVAGSQAFNPVIASNFYNPSLTYLRCKRLLNANQFKFNIMRNIAILPLIAGLVYFTACDKPAEPIEKTVEVERNLGDPVTEDEKISFPGGDEGLINYLSENTKYPERAKKLGAEGRAMVSFQVNEEGIVNSVKIIESSGNDDLDNEATRVISEMPQWESSISGENEEVVMELVIPIVFKLPEAEE